MKVNVMTVFRDKFTHRLYNPNEIIEIENEARIEDLVKRQLVEIVSEKKETKGITLFEKEVEKKALVEALKSVGAQVTGIMGEKTLLDKIVELDEEATTKLKEALGIE